MRIIQPLRLRLNVWLATFLAAVVLVPSLGSTQAAYAKKTDSTPDTINMGIFGKSLPLIVADAKGFYAKHNLTVKYMQVQSSTQQFDYLGRDLYDVIQTSPDNVANYRLNTHNPLCTDKVCATIDAQGFLGLDYGLNLRLVARPDIKKVEDLKGKTLSVDAENSGFAYVLYKILQQHGLKRGVDYNVISVGGVFQRYNDLMADQNPAQGQKPGLADATLLSSGFETRASNDGYVLLDPVSTIASPYIGTFAAAKTTWLQKNSDVATRFALAYYEALQWSFDPSNREEAINLWAAQLTSQSSTPRLLAEQLYDIHLQKGVGDIEDASIDHKAVYNILALRAEFGGFEDQQNLHRLASPESGLYDLSYYRKALRDYHRGF